MRVAQSEFQQAMHEIVVGILSTPTKVPNEAISPEPG
jgi:hypothetical protein